MFLKFRYTFAAAAAIIVFGLFLRYEIKNLPEVPQLRFWEPARSSKLLDRSGKPIFEYAVEKRDFASISEMPSFVIDSVIAIEDERFFKHWGFDTKAFLRAMLINLTRGRFVQGGSTISQQLALNLFMQREMTIARKLRELMLALYIESNFSKEEILEMYLNQVYLGHGVYGISKGAKSYFSKDIARLNLNEAATLAALIKAPAHYSPITHPKRSHSRMKLVLGRMKELGYITPAMHAQACTNEVVVSTTPSQLPMEFAHFIEYIRQDVENRYSPERLWKGGLVIKTTLDMEYQKLAHEKMLKIVEDFDLKRLEREQKEENLEFSTETTKIEAAMSVVETRTGKILV
ncbi:transglycosylase domain-containing protein, partial [Elusimicrobiota bacterium]